MFFAQVFIALVIVLSKVAMSDLMFESPEASISPGREISE